MMRKVLAFFGYCIKYVCKWGTYVHRYNSLDAHVGRPIHEQMSVAPPWAKLVIYKCDPN